MISGTDNLIVSSSTAPKKQTLSSGANVDSGAFQALLAILLNQTANFSGSAQNGLTDSSGQDAAMDMGNLNILNVLGGSGSLNMSGALDSAGTGSFGAAVERILGMSNGSSSLNMQDLLSGMIPSMLDSVRNTGTPDSIVEPVPGNVSNGRIANDSLLVPNITAETAGEGDLSILALLDETAKENGPVLGNGTDTLAGSIMKLVNGVKIPGEAPANSENAKSDTKLDAGSETKPPVGLSTQIAVSPDAKSDAGLIDKPVVNSGVKIAGVPDIKSDAKPDTGFVTKPEIGPDVKIAAGPDIKPDVKPDTGTDTKPVVSLDSETAVSPDVKPDAKISTGLATKPEISSDVKITAGSDTKPDVKPDTGIVTKPDAKSDTGLKDKAEPLHSTSVTAAPVDSDTTKNAVQPKVQDNKPVDLTSQSSSNTGDGLKTQSQSLNEAAGEANVLPGEQVNPDRKSEVKDKDYIVQRYDLLKILKGQNTAVTESGSGNDTPGKDGTEKGDGQVKHKEGDKGGVIKLQDFASKIPDKPQEIVHGLVQHKEAQVNSSQQISSGKEMPAGINKEDILNQIYDKIKVTSGKDMSELHLNLKPEELGEVSIKLVMEKGMMTGRILVENSHVKHLIESNLPQIKDSLKSQNSNISGFSVSVGLKQDGQQYNQNFSHNRWAHKGSSYSRGNFQEAAMEAVTGAVNNGALNILA